MARARALVAVVAASFAVSCADPAPVASVRAIDETANSTPGSSTSANEYIVALEPGATLPAEAVAASGGTIVDRVPALNAYAVTNVSNPEALRVSGTKYIEAQAIITVNDQRMSAGERITSGDAAGVPGTLATFYQRGRLWGMQITQADQVWATTNAGEGARACVVDTGVDGTHQDLAGQLIAAANFVVAAPLSPEDTPLDKHGHGTHVAGTIAGKGVVITGVAPAAKILSARVLNTAGSGTVTAIANGIIWCADNGAHVINMSLGGLRFIGSSSYASSLATYGAAIAYANAAGSVVVASSGNSNVQLPNSTITFHPATVPGAVSVGATGPLSKSGMPNGTGTTAATKFDPFDPAKIWRVVDNKAYYSNFGSGVMVFAPGGRGSIPFSEPYRTVGGVLQGQSSDNIWSACANTGGSCAGLGTNLYIAFAGTSMAAPHVAGLAAALYAEPAIGLARNAANQLRVKNCILNTTDVIGPASTYGGGRINVKKAIDALALGAC